MSPGNMFVIGTVMGETALQDADPAVAQRSQRLVMSVPDAPVGVVVDTLQATL